MSGKGRVGERNWKRLLLGIHPYSTLEHCIYAHACAANGPTCHTNSWRMCAHIQLSGEAKGGCNTHPRSSHPAHDVAFLHGEFVPSKMRQQASGLEPRDVKASDNRAIAMVARQKITSEIGEKHFLSTLCE